MPLDESSLAFVVGSYELQDGLSRDAVSETWLARNTDDSTPARFVRLRSDARDVAEARRAFLSELRQHADSTLPGTARVLEVVRSGDDVGVAIEQLPGLPLSEVLEHGRPPQRVALRWLADLCGAVASVHQNAGTQRSTFRLLLGDIRPENVQVLPGGAVALIPTGLGIALAHSDDESVQAHLAPEQRGGAGRVDARADVWALARLAYQLLIDVEADAPSWESSALGAELQEVFAEAMHVEPAKRPANADVLSRSLAKAGTLADRLQVAAWFDTTFGHELAAQRLEVEQAESHAPAREPQGEPSSQEAKETTPATADAAAPAVIEAAPAADESTAEEPGGEDSSEQSSDAGAVEAQPVERHAEVEAKNDGEDAERSEGVAGSPQKSGKKSRKQKKRDKRRSSLKPAASVAAEPPSGEQTADAHDDEEADAGDERKAAPKAAPAVVEADERILVPVKKSSTPLIAGGVAVAAAVALFFAWPSGEKDEASGKPQTTVEAKANTKVPPPPAAADDSIEEPVAEQEPTEAETGEAAAAPTKMADEPKAEVAKAEPVKAKAVKAEAPAAPKPAAAEPKADTQPAAAGVEAPEPAKAVAGFPPVENTPAPPRSLPAEYDDKKPAAPAAPAPAPAPKAPAKAPEKPAIPDGI